MAITLNTLIPNPTTFMMWMHVCCLLGHKVSGAAKFGVKGHNDNLCCVKKNNNTILKFSIANYYSFCWSTTVLIVNFGPEMHNTFNHKLVKNLFCLMLFLNVHVDLFSLHVVDSPECIWEMM